MAVRTLSLCFRSGRFWAGCFRFSKVGLCCRVLFRRQWSCGFQGSRQRLILSPCRGTFFQFRVFGGSGRQFSRLRSDRCSGRLISLLPALRSVVWHALCNSIVNCGSATAVRFLHLFKFGLVVLGGQPPEAAGNREIPCCFCLARSQACRTFFQQVAKTFIRDSFPALSGCNIRPTALRYLLRPPLPARKSKEKPRPTFVRRGLLCPGQDSNLHELNVHYPLKVACLPISPPGRHMTETCISGAQI